jgi:ubiquinone/menaquinone biosynthesis C-methylase UbiE
MNHKDHVALLQKGISEKGGIWADLGSGSGAFTLAIADLLGSTGGKIYSIDKDRRALKEQEKAMRSNFPSANVEYRVADFTQQLDLPDLDGIVMANSLHYVRHKESTLQLIRSYLRPGGRIILVEYNTDRGNMWVPYPLTYKTWETLAHQNGFTQTQLLSTVPSRYFGEIYSALSLRPHN